jgi:hypothetical protein
MFIHENAIDLGVPHLARNSQLFSIFQTGYSGGPSTPDDTSQDRMA